MDLWDVVALNAMEEVPDYYVPWLDRQQKRADAPRAAAARQLQRFRRHRLDDERPQAGDRAQQLDDFRHRQPLDHRVRHRAHARLPHHSGRLPRHHRQRRRLRHQLLGTDGDRDHHHRLFAVRSQRQAGVRARAQGVAVCQLDRRVREDHARRQQRRLRQRLAAGRQQDRRGRALRAGTEDAPRVAHEGRLLRGLEFSQRSGADQEGNRLQSRRTWAAR